MEERPSLTLEEFLVAPIEEIAKVAPACMIYAPGGTRRHAVLEGIEPWSEEYMQWALMRTFACCDLIFQHGVQHLFIPLLISTTYNESNHQREKVFAGIHRLLAGPETLAEYQRLGWRVRLIGGEGARDWATISESLCKATTTQRDHTLYWLVMPSIDAPWQQLLPLMQHTPPQTRAEAIRTVYGEDIPLATLYLAFGKPMVSLEIVPPLLMGQLQCYWSQQPGYTLTERQLRMIFYDYAYIRNTWQEEKLERAKEVLLQRQAWEEGPMLGFGMRLGSFWYPAPMSSPVWPKENGIITA